MNIDRKLEIILMALKEAFLERSIDKGIRVVQGELLDDLSENVRTYANQVKFKINGIISQEGLNRLNIPEEYREYISCEVKEIIKGLPLDHELLMNCSYDVQKLEECLWRRYTNENASDKEYGSEIKKVLHQISYTIVECIKQENTFPSEITVGLLSKQEEIQESIQEIPSQTAKKIQEIMEELSITEENVYKEKSYLPNEAITYLNMWNENLFLNDFYEGEEGVNIKLSDLYMPLRYTGTDTKKSKSDIENKIFSVIEAQTRKRRMLLILGQPGIGKSSLVSWFANKYKERNVKKELLIYRFSSFDKVDWNSRESEESNIIGEILNEIGVQKGMLRDKVIFLEGFDEIAVERRMQILNDLYSLSYRYDATFFVTCRENYIEKLNELRCQYITLSPWKEEQIDAFSKLYQEKSKTVVSNETVKKMQELHRVFGIPLIAYMVLALEINLDMESSIVDVYDKIFDEKGGIYKRGYDEAHRIGNYGREFRIFNKEIALWILKNNWLTPYIPSKYYRPIAEKICQESGRIKSVDFFIGCYYKKMKHTEMAEQTKLYFIHRTILEYFVATAIYEKIENEMLELSEENQRKAAKEIGVCLVAGRALDKTINQYLVYKIEHFWEKNSIEKAEANKWWQSLIKNVLNHGLCYYSSHNRENGNFLDREIFGFGLLLRLYNDLFEKKYRGYLRLNEKGDVCEDYMFQADNHEEKYQLELYIRYFYLADYTSIPWILSKFNLPEMHFSFFKMHKGNFRNSNLKYSVMAYMKGIKCDFKGANMKITRFDKSNFEESNFAETDLQRTEFTYVNFKNSHFEKADLKKAEFENATFYNSFFDGADLRGAKFQKTRFKYVSFEGADLRGAKFIMTNFSGMNFVGADLRDTEFLTTDLEFIDFIKADLRGVKMKKTYLKCVFMKDSRIDEENIKKMNLKFDLINEAHIV